MRVPSDSRNAREKLQQMHEDIVQDAERGIPFLLRFNQYFDISGIHDTEYQHYVQQSMNGTEHPKMRVSAADDFAEEAEKKTESLGRAMTREEVEELFLARDAVLMNKASRKEIDEGHLPHDTREKIYRPKPTAAARRTRTAAPVGTAQPPMEQAQLDVIKAEVKRSGINAAERAAKQAVAAALGMEYTDEAPDEAQEAEYAAASGNATCAVDFAASAEWKEMKQWRTKVEADSAEAKKTMTKLAETQSKMAGDFATGRAENQANFDALTAVLTNMQRTMVGGQQQPQQAPVALKGPCKKCKVEGHGRNMCPKGDDEARTMRFAWYGKQNTAPRQSAMTDMLVCALQTLTPAKGATKTTLQLTLDVHAQESASTCDVKWTSKISHDNVMPQGQQQSHKAATSTCRIDKQEGILSDATTGSKTPRIELPTEATTHASMGTATPPCPDHAGSAPNTLTGAEVVL